MVEYLLVLVFGVPFAAVILKVGLAVSRNEDLVVCKKTDGGSNQ